MSGIKWILLILAAVSGFGMTAGTVAAQSPAEEAPVYQARSEHTYGVGLMMNYPFDSFGNEYNTGWGLHGMVDYVFIPLLHFVGDVGWNHFPGNDNREALDVFEFTFGAKFQFGAFFMGGESGYYTEVNEWSFVPSMGLRFSRFEVAFRIKAVGGSSWNGLRLGYYF